MNKIYVPENYRAKLSMRENQNAIEIIKRSFEKFLTQALNLKRVSAPLFVTKSSGLNDNLNGVERPVEFDIKNMSEHVEIVHSLAKWKRQALFNYKFNVGEGLYTNMNAIRRDEDLDNVHSVYVDQWDWEKVITREDRNLDYLKQVVKKIVTCISMTLAEVKKNYDAIDLNLNDSVEFITSQELEDKYPDLDPKEREYKFAKDNKCIFIMQVGDVLKSGQKQDGRAPDYDDWKLNGDLIYWDDIINSPLEISSMGIRVDAKSLEEQLEKSNNLERKKFDFHRAILEDKLPLTIGGGIGQSRLCMLLLQKAHIGEVQASVWNDEILNECKKNNICLL